MRNLGRPMAMVLNMIDIARHRGITIDVDRLSHELGVPVVTAVAVRRSGYLPVPDLASPADRQIVDRGGPLAPGRAGLDAA